MTRPTRLINRIDSLRFARSDLVAWHDFDLTDLERPVVGSAEIVIRPVVRTNRTGFSFSAFAQHRIQKPS